MSYDRGPVQPLVRLLEVFALADESAVIRMASDLASAPGTAGGR